MSPLEYINIVALDPGVDTVGLAVLGVHPKTHELHLQHVETIHTKHHLKGHLDDCIVLGNRGAKIRAIQRVLKRTIEKWVPVCIVHESPFMGRFPQAFAALVEVCQAIKIVVHESDLDLELDWVDPKSAKVVVGVDGSSKMKEDVILGVSQLKYLKYDDSARYLLSMQSEHASDAVAVGYWKYIQIYKGGDPANEQDLINTNPPRPAKKRRSRKRKKASR